jgi:hypothetical protein
MWDPKPGEVYAAYQWWDTFESWHDHFPKWVDEIRTKYVEGPLSFGLFKDPGRRCDIRRANFEFDEERRLPFWLARMHVEVASHLPEQPELEEQVRQATTVSFDVWQKRHVIMLAAAEWHRCEVLPHIPGIEVPKHPVGSYGVELTVANSAIAKALSQLQGSPATGGDWLLIRVYLHIMKLREVP